MAIKFRGSWDSAKYDGRKLKLSLRRRLGLGKRKIRLFNADITGMTWAPSDSRVSKVVSAVRGEDAIWSMYIQGQKNGKTQTFRVEVVNFLFIGKKTSAKDVRRAIEFLRGVSQGVGLIEVQGTGGEILFSKTRLTSDAEMKKMIVSLGAESEIETAQEIFLDDEPDDDFENDE
jgi:hypothetical protein